MKYIVSFVRLRVEAPSAGLAISAAADLIVADPQSFVSFVQVADIQAFIDPEEKSS